MAKDTILTRWQKDFFTCEEGKAAQAARVQEAVCKDRLKDLYHEAHL